MQSFGVRIAHDEQASVNLLEAFCLRFCGDKEPTLLRMSVFGMSRRDQKLDNIGRVLGK